MIVKSIVTSSCGAAETYLVHSVLSATLIGDVAMADSDKMSYLMLFCGLLIMHKSGSTLNEMLATVPLAGNARNLAWEIANREFTTNSSY